MARASCTLIAVFTDEGVTGWGSVFTSDQLVRGALGANDAFWPQDYKWALRTADMLARHIVQPDATKVGGISETRRIA